MKKFSYWHWNNLISKEQIIEINKLIEKNYNFIEGKEKAAKDSRWRKAAKYEIEEIKSEL